VLLLAAALSLLTACAAMGATRYAAPGGTGADPCADPNNACSIYTAADSTAPGTTIEAGDVVELLPGTYSETAGDLGPFDYVALQGVTVRGTPLHPPPLIRLQKNLSNTGPFQVFEDSLISHLEIENEAEGGFSVSLFGGTMERVIVRAPENLSIVCNVVSGTIRSSACINEGGGAAMGASIGTAPQTFTTVIRNSTAIATGPGSVGVEFHYGATGEGLVATISAKGLIAKGAAKDVVAKGRETSGSGKGASTTITLDHSSYATVGTETSGSGGSASVTPPGTNANITAAPLLAGDLIHQLPGSPTIGKGAVDAKSSPFDIDGEARTGGLAPDIGADELAYSTTTFLRCNSGGTSVGGQTICEVVVEDADGALTQPGGSVALSSEPGLSLPSSCTLNPLTAASSTCPFVVAANAAGTHTITATYLGDDLHDGSEALAAVAVAGLPATPPILVVSNPNPNTAPATQLKKHPPKRTTKRQAKFTFSSNEAGSRFECKLDKGPFRACSSPYRKKVGLGSHEFQVRAVDPQGGVDQTPAAFRWRVVQP
jgi:hypothetical protein